MTRESTSTWIISEELEGERLDVVLTDLLDGLLSRSQIAKLIQAGEVSVNDRRVSKSGFRFQGGEQVSLRLPDPKVMELIPDPTVPFRVVFEDEDLLVIDKPAGVVTHPGAGVSSGTLVHGLLSYLGDSLQQVGDTLRPGIVHRLDRGTSGLLVVAKHQQSFQGLQKQFLPPRTIHRRYLAFVHSTPSVSSGVITLPIDRDPVNRVRMATVKSGGRSATTHWSLLEEYPFGALLQVDLETGRTHQIRVHLEAIRSPILGDELYTKFRREPPSKELSREIAGLKRQALHATSLTFLHRGEEVSFSSPLPEDLLHLQNTLRGRS